MEKLNFKENGNFVLEALKCLLCEWECRTLMDFLYTPFGMEKVLGTDQFALKCSSRKTYILAIIQISPTGLGNEILKHRHMIG
ncbi:hypothetical protein HNY73_002163 [Argiope bruennichi]|uniref:Uncharacterized protein n=1 Tax=Argiope bruennichi TaxID=94029 RepID=A0A8T0FTQ5_ARGBR|nr:hypothetical protein HNY73_002163 [Argiope bruennichi]